MIHNRVKEVKKRKSLASLLVTAALMVTALLPASVFAVEDNSSSLKPYNNDLLYERTFDSGLCFPWHTCEDTGGVCDFEVVDVSGSNKAMALKIEDPGENKWSVQLRHRMITMESGHTYTISFKMWAEKACKAYVKVGMIGEPYTDYFSNKWTPIEVGTSSKQYTFEYKHEAATDETCEFAFHCGNGMTSGTNTVYLDDASIYDPQFTKPDVEILEMPEIRVNQVGYFPNGEKTATVVSDSTSPLTWKLLKGGSQVATGKTEVKGLDPDSQDYVHKIDFSDYTTEGTGYILTAGSSNSHPFDISTSIYSTMKDDAIKYFYHNRSGIEIEAKYAGRSDLARPAGHLDVSPNKGDKNVSTMPGAAKSYSLDVTGGWYDAGDHGKYVVNGGISLWTLLNQYERESIVEGGDLTRAPYADDTMNIPESGNGVPDILDEAKWEMDWMMKMQVPSSKDSSLAGMVHHKIHDEKWTALGLLPSEDPQTRYLRPVSTAATLNLAATGAQASRIWEGLGDSTYANKCLEAAETAWKAALKHPDTYAPYDNENGGGPYNDNNVTDEFYWAACELYLTTGKDEYKDYLTSSEHYLVMPSVLGEGEDAGLTACFTWGSTQGLGTISLALVENGLGDSEIAKAKANIASACDPWLENIDNQGYGLPIVADSKGDYPWGSNSFIANMAITFGYAFDFTGNTKYLDGMKQSMDYLLGRNGLDQSYITGYGERATMNPHHRFWAHQLSDKWPLAPAGILAGGPNSNFEDPTINAAVTKDTPPQKCYIDNLDAWSVNEITINWNAPLAWVAAYLDEKGNATGGGGGSKVLLGDANQDEQVNAIDFGTMRKSLLGQMELTGDALKAADVDQNGQFNAIDFAYMRKYLLGMIKDFETLK